MEDTKTLPFKPSDDLDSTQNTENKINLTVERNFKAAFILPVEIAQVKEGLTEKIELIRHVWE